MASKCYRSELVGLFGDPVDENPTVVTIEAGFKALGLNYRYNTMRVLPENLEKAIKSLKALGFKGTHITIPHKVQVLKYLDHVSPEAKIMGAVNTVYIKDGETYGENTDGKGFMISINEAGIEVKGRKVVMLGAGGVARAISVELAKAGAKSITIVNIEEDCGQELVSLLNKNTPTTADFVLWRGTYKVPEDTEIFVQATSVGLYPDKNTPNIDYSTLKPKMTVCDVVFNPPQTEFLKRAKAVGCKTLDGLTMLVNQGGISFELWTGQKAPMKEMREATAAEFAQQ